LDAPEPARPIGQLEEETEERQAAGLSAQEARGRRGGTYS
jgi:hypothetical protein